MQYQLSVRQRDYPHIALYFPTGKGIIRGRRGGKEGKRTGREKGRKGERSGVKDVCAVCMFKVYFLDMGFISSRHFIWKRNHEADKNFH
jgi:hypothetical protein